MEPLYIGVDLGGTNIAAGVVTGNGHILCKKSIKTKLPQKKEKIEEKIYILVKNLLSENNIDINKIKAIGIGTPGIVNSSTGIVGFNANFGYRNWNLKQQMEQLISKPVYVENDANVALIAEMFAGNARGYKDAAIVTIGTGIGAGIAINGQVFSGSNFFGTELGHMVIDFNGRPCKCGRKGCFEQYASATALTRDAVLAMEQDKTSLLWKLSPTPNRVNAKTVFDAMRKNDTTAKSVVDKYIAYLACGVINLINIFQPQIICIGGGLSNENNYILNPLQKIIDKEDYARDSLQRTKIVIAKFKNDAGIIGAALLGVNNA